MTPAEFRAARERLGLTRPQLARLLGVDARSVARWEADGTVQSRQPSPLVCRVLRWLLAGFRPPEWPA